jgi:isoleucyl-tRNA synthetase
MFDPLPAQFSFPEAEKRILEFWEQHNIFQKSLDGRRGAPRFVFYEGPPTANGLPHPGHCLTRSIKDLFPRYQTMCGKLVERKAGWDTHGLPVEVEVCKELGIHTKQEIEAYGVEKFVRKCIESVFRYTREWEQMTRRLGFWVNLEEAYVTFHQSYVESVWWSLKTLFDRGLLYQGHKVVWWWAQGGTALSAGEVGEGYRTVRDPSVYVRFPLVAAGLCTGRADVAADPRVGRSLPEIPPGKRVSLLVWTTTPWTLISNHFAAVGPDVDYSLVHDAVADEYLYIASALVIPTAEKSKHKLETVATCKGSDLVGLRYTPPFHCYATTLANQTAKLKDGGERALAWRIVPADFIDLETGTGIVHIAPAYGEVDFNLLQDERQRFVGFDAIPLLNAVNPDGNFSDEAPPAYRGRWVKDCDKEIMRELKDRGLLYHQETIEHEYPFCPRAEDDPLIQYARKSWFVRTSQFKDEFLKNNGQVNWRPEHIQEGRFGDFLRNNVDWALSRERYWGTPLPIWVCEQTGKMEAIGSYAELLAKPGVQGLDVWEQAKKADPALPDHLKVHKPYIDAVTYASPYASGYFMRRVPEVIDCWWDAGSMPFAQWGFPHVPESVGTFAERFPADFISEAIDQTRGWFYGLLSISTLLFGDTGALTTAWNAIENRGAELEAKFVAGKSLEEIAASIQPERPDPLRANSFLLTLAPLGLEAIGRDVEKLRERAQSASMLKAIVSPQQTKGLPPRDGRYPIPYKACIVLGHVMGEDGLKMSKRTKNYKEPSYIFDSYGADAMRWFFFSAQPPWTSVRFQEANIRDAQREFLVRLYNVFSFFNIYANIDRFQPRYEGTELRPTEEGGRRRHEAGDEAQSRIQNPRSKIAATSWRPVPQRSELDRWIIGELHRAIRDVRAALDRFENFPAAGRLKDFVDALSNWYVRRSRERFWRATERRSDAAAKAAPAWSASDQDKWDAYNTLYECLLTLSKLIAPFTPFFAETMYQNLTGTQGRRDEWTKPGTLSPSVPLSLRPLSVHLCDYPQTDESLIDESLAQEMDLVRDIVSLGRAARTAAKLKVRQPLALAEIILTRREHAAWLEAHSALIAEELNIKRVELTAEAEHYVTYQVKPDFKAIGPKFGKLAPQVAAALAKLDAAAARKTLTETGRLAVELADGPVHLTAQEIEIRLEAKPGWSAAQGRGGVVVVKTELSAELRDEGLCRELIHQVQALRKALNLPYEARVTLYAQADEQVLAVLRRFASVVESECLAPTIKTEAPPAGAEVWTGKVEGHAATLGIARA